MSANEYVFARYTHIYIIIKKEQKRLCLFFFSFFLPFPSSIIKVPFQHHLFQFYVAFLHTFISFLHASLIVSYFPIYIFSQHPQKLPRKIQTKSKKSPQKKTQKTNPKRPQKNLKPQNSPPKPPPSPLLFQSAE